MSRALSLEEIRFGEGSHSPTVAPTGDRDMCIMEAVAYMAGEPWSDTPACASPVIAAFLRAWNDALSDEDRDRLLPAAVWVPRLVGSRGDEATEERRAYLALDWLVRVHAPAWFNSVSSLAPHAAALRALPEVVDLKTARLAGTVVRNAEAAAGDAARDAAHDAAWGAAGAAAWDAAWDAAGAAARDAAWGAAGAAARGAARGAAWDAAWGAAWDAAWGAVGAAAGGAAGGAARDAAWDAAGAAARDIAHDAAWDAAWGAAWDAARGAAGDALRPTVETLQQSALDLLERMLEVRS